MLFQISAIVIGCLATVAIGLPSDDVIIIHDVITSADLHPLPPVGDYDVYDDVIPAFHPVGGYDVITPGDVHPLPPVGDYDVYDDVIPVDGDDVTLVEDAVLVEDIAPVILT